MHGKVVVWWIVVFLDTFVFLIWVLIKKCFCVCHFLQLLVSFVFLLARIRSLSFWTSLLYLLKFQKKWCSIICCIISSTIYIIRALQRPYTLLYRDRMGSNDIIGKALTQKSNMRYWYKDTISSQIDFWFVFFIELAIFF